MPFTVVFKDDGTIDKIFKVALTAPRTSDEVLECSGATARGSSRDVSDHLHGKTVSNITSVTIVTTNDHGVIDPCIKDGTGREWCW